MAEAGVADTQAAAAAAAAATEAEAQVRRQAIETMHMLWSVRSNSKHPAASTHVPLPPNLCGHGLSD
jgi:hypothetical protein